MTKFSLYISSLFLVLLFGCKQNDPLNDNDFTDLTGLQITLEWSLSKSTGNPTDDVNLDLELTFNNSIVQESTSNFGFESLELKDFNPNGNYDLNIYYYEGDEPLDYVITVSGQSSFKTRQYTGSFSSADKGRTFTVIQIHKDGNNYNLF